MNCERTSVFSGALPFNVRQRLATDESCPLKLILHASAQGSSPATRCLLITKCQRTRKLIQLALYQSTICLEAQLGDSNLRRPAPPCTLPTRTLPTRVQPTLPTRTDKRACASDTRWRLISCSKLSTTL